MWFYYVLPFVVVAASVPILAALVVVLWTVGVSLPGVGGTVNLDCPHCGAATPSNLPGCRACGRSFRDPPDSCAKTSTHA